MTDNADLFARALARIDAANAEDPNRTVAGGVDVPHELHYSRRMTHWLGRVAPDAPEALRLAVRAQHLCRWMYPRSDYPMDLAGYRRWRIGAANFHARLAGQILGEVGYDDAVVRRVQALLRKEGIKHDPDVQALEDVACLAFLENEFLDFARKHDEEKLGKILVRTLRKMSPVGHFHAMHSPEVPAEAKALIEALTTGRTEIAPEIEARPSKPTGPS